MSYAILFRSDRFLFAAPDGTEVDLPYGMDLAWFLHAGLPQRMPDWKIGEPFFEDYGSCLLVHRGPTTIALSVWWHPLPREGEPEEDTWLLLFRPMHGCLSLRRTPPTDPDEPVSLKSATESVLRDGAPTGESIQWLTEPEFRAMRCRW